MFRFVILIALVPAIFATTGLKSCRSNVPQPSSINIEGCDAAPCNVGLGTTAKMSLSFVAPVDIESFSPAVQAGVLGLWIDYALPSDVLVGCNFLEGSRCPISQGEDVIYNFLFGVDLSYPKISVDVELNVVSAGNKLFCVQIPIRVVDAPVTTTVVVPTTTVASTTTA